MKNFFVRPLPTVVAAGVLFLAGCDGAPSGSVARTDAPAAAQGGQVQGGHDMASMTMTELPAGEATDASLYVLDQSWTDQAGRTVHLSDLAGRPRVIAMVYTHCTWACPRIVAEMKRLEAAVSDLPAEDAPGFVLVSIDPARDTPDHLADFARDTRLDPTRWTLLTGPEDQVLELSVLLGVKYRATPDGAFSHSNLVTVLDAQGAVAARLEGLDADLDAVIRTLRRLGGAPAA